MNLLRIFYHGTVAICFLGFLMLLAESDVDIYSFWVVATLILGSYLIENKQKLDK